MEMMLQGSSRMIAVIGLGYVGCVSAGCLAKMGWEVVGIDVNEAKVSQINSGKPTIVEEGMESLIAEQHDSGRLSADTDLIAAVSRADVCLICVGTPSNKNGMPDMTFIWKVAEGIRDAIADKNGFLTIALRSTVPPGTCRRFEEIVAESGKRIDVDFAVVSNPEFLREGNSIHDYFHPPYTLIGTRNDRALRVLRQIYGNIDAPVIETAREIGEMIKYVNNSFHALKVVFANEVGAICDGLGIDPYPVMELFCKDRQLNISQAYLMPGFAYGGSCLPKDLRALQAFGRLVNEEIPVLSVIERSNQNQISRALKLILAEGRVRVGILGLAFKQGTDDLRESPIVVLLEQLLGKGYAIRIHDHNVTTSRLIGTNRQYIESTVPHLSQFLEPDLNELERFAELIVVAQKNDEYMNFVANILDRKKIVDLVRIIDNVPASSNYKGILW